MSKSSVLTIGAVSRPNRAIAAAYNQAGEGYVTYADGDPAHLFAFDGQYAYGDRCIWNAIDGKLGTLKASGMRTVRLLDLGCGPGAWLRRAVTRAHALGFETIVARGVDLADEQVAYANAHSTDLMALPGVSLSFEVGDITEKFHEANSSIDLCLCLCGVLNHVRPPAMAGVFSEIARVTAGHFITTVRAVGSTPTVYVGAVEEARHFHQDNQRDWLDIELQTGRHVSFPSHLFAAEELTARVSHGFEVEDLVGIDLFHGRFASDARWNPRLEANEPFARELERLEHQFCRNQAFIDHATHLLLVARKNIGRSAK